MNKLKVNIKKAVKNFLLLIPFVKTKIHHYNRANILLHNSGFEPGHFYSPIPNLSEIEKDMDRIFTDKVLLGVDLNKEYQMNLLDEFKSYYSEYPYLSNKKELQGYRYKKEGAYYRFSDSVFLYSMIRSFKPKKIIEIGSGHSSAIMLDVNELFFKGKIHCTFIDPFPQERLFKILRESDKITNEIIEDKVQSVNPDIFQALEKNDILFIDSTHVSKIGSDVNYLILEVLPKLKPGVLIHFHDIFYPFELPKEWVLKNRWFWNENYLLHAFLINNKNYEIVAFNSYLQKTETNWFSKEMPECLLGSEDTGSIWIRKLV